MKKEKILLAVGISFVVLVLTIVMVYAASSSQNSYKDKLQLMKCKNNVTFDRNNCLKEAIVRYYNCSSGNINYSKNRMDFFKYLGECRKNVLRPFQKICKDNYNVAILNCKTLMVNNSVCGNGICDVGEANFCPACVYSHPACMIACRAGTCPQDCPSQNITG